MLGACHATTTSPRSSARPLSESAAAFGPGLPEWYGGASSYSADGLPLGWDESADSEGIFTQMFEWARTVYHGTACDLPGVSVRYEPFVSDMWAAVRAGFVQPVHAEFVQRGLRWGFEAGLHPSRLFGVRVFSNYESATGDWGRDRVAEATEARVAAGRTLDLGPWAPSIKSLLGRVFGTAFVFPLGAVAKALEPDKARPTDDHTRTGLNAATDMTFLGHTLDTLERIAQQLLPGYAMHVSDVEAAFPTLPWAPWLWPMFFHRFTRRDDPSALHLYAHVNGDFGTRGLPGAFKIFFVDVVVNMARAHQRLTLPLEVFVDDLSCIGCTPARASRDMSSFQDYAESLGLVFKRIKDRRAHYQQLMLGFVWNSFARTRTLESRKLQQYLTMFWDYSNKQSLTLRERQSAAGRMQRAAMTMPPGAQCLIASTFQLMAGLVLPWQKRRTTHAERSNFRFFHDVLQMNLGMGYFSYDGFEWGPEVRSDASKQKRYAGGGWVSACGRYSWFKYGTSAARQPIDFLEGDTVIDAIESLGPGWRGKKILFGVDNQAFQKSAVKGWSRADRLTLLLKRLFVLQIRYGCVIFFYWISTHDNDLADHLSREGRQALFHATAATSDFLLPGAELIPEGNAGCVRNLDTSAPISAGSFADLEWESQEAMIERLLGLDLALLLMAVVALQRHVRGWLARRPGLERQTWRRRPKRSVGRDAIEGALHRMREERDSHRREERIRVNVVYIQRMWRLSRWYSKEAVDARFEAEWQEREAEREGRPVRPVHARNRLPLLHIVALLGCWLVSGVHSAPKDGYSAQVASVPYERAYLWEGLPDVWTDRLDEIMDNRLSAKSMSTVGTAWRKWLLVCDAYGWDAILYTDDKTRAGKMVCFVLHLLEDTELVADSISTYVWGLRWAMKLRHQADPVMGVMLWQDFMTGVRVLSHVPSEPRRALPMELLIAMGEAVNTASFMDVQLYFFLLILFFTFSRSECPCPKHYTGPESWDDNKHWMVRDIVIRLVSDVYVLCVRFKAIKQDARIERPSARGDGSDRGASQRGGSDWSYIGDVPNSILSPFMWYRRLMAFYDGPRPPTSPFFVDESRRKPFLYSTANRKLKELVGRVQPDDVDYACHGLRVEGYNRGKAAAGEDLAVAHGGWKPGSNSKYDRFALLSVFALSAKMAAYQGRTEESEVQEEDTVEASSVHVRAGEPRVAATPSERRQRSTTGVPALLSSIGEGEEEVVGGDDADEVEPEQEHVQPQVNQSAQLVQAAAAAAVQRVAGSLFGPTPVVAPASPAAPTPSPPPQPRTSPSPRRSSPPRLRRR